MTPAAEPSNSELTVEQARPTPELPQTIAAGATQNASSSVLGWFASKARSVGGACLHAIASPAAGTLVFTSVCAVLVYRQRKMHGKTLPTSPPSACPRAARSLSRSVSFALLQRGKKAMERFRAIRKAAVADEVARKKSLSDAALEYLRTELHEEESCKEEEKLQNKKLNFVELYEKIGILEMSGKEEEAIKVLKEALKRMKGSHTSHTHDVHEIELLLVEMLIFKGGDLNEALDCTCLSGGDAVSAADPRVPLYQTIIYFMMKDKNREAEEKYNKFKDIGDNFHSPKVDKNDSSMFFEVPDEEELKEIVKALEEEIKEAHRPSEAAAHKPLEHLH